MNRGKLVIVAMVVVGVALSSFAWWNRWSRSQRVIAHWGAEASAAIRVGETVELMRLIADEADHTGEILTSTNPPQRVAEVADISQAPGLIHARHQLLQPEAFDWNEPRQPGHEPRWTRAMRFTRGKQTATFLLDFRGRRVLLLERHQDVGLNPIAEALEKFLRDVQPVKSNPTSVPADTQ